MCTEGNVYLVLEWRRFFRGYCTLIFSDWRRILVAVERLVRRWLLLPVSQSATSHDDVLVVHILDNTGSANAAMSEDNHPEPISHVLHLVNLNECAHWMDVVEALDHFEITFLCPGNKQTGGLRQRITRRTSDRG